jgi:hypothetical protein
MSQGTSALLPTLTSVAPRSEAHSGRTCRSLEREGRLNDLPSDEIQLDFVAERAIESADMSFMTGFLHSRGCNT